MINPQQTFPSMVKTEGVSPKDKDAPLTILFNIVFDVLAIAIREKKK